MQAADWNSEGLSYILFLQTTYFTFTMHYILHVIPVRSHQ